MDELSSNVYRHQPEHISYAHYSQIDEYDIEKHPDLAKTSPIRVTLRAGQSLYIPAKWWHWVNTLGKSFAVNYWFTNLQKHEPFVFDHTFEFDTTILNNEDVYPWRSEKHHKYPADPIPTTFEKFHNSGEDHRYLMTIGVYYYAEAHASIREIMASHIVFPTDDRIDLKATYDFNVWASSGKHDTGLHYDDEDGVLTVLEGEKEIILFPPSDAQYLDPYPMSYAWREEPAWNFLYNMGIRVRCVEGVPSNELLYTTCQNEQLVLCNISKLYAGFDNSNELLIWGYKRAKDGDRWEFYHYTPNDPEVKVKSWDIYPDEREIRDVNHYYYKDEDCEPTLPYWGYGKQKEGDVWTQESRYFIDTTESFAQNYDHHMDKLGFSDIKEKFRSVIFDRYQCPFLCLHIKKPGEIFIQHLGISNEDFIEFLTTQEYPSHIIDFVKSNVENGTYQINNEITIVYDTETQEVIRSAIYGNL